MRLSLSTSSSTIVPDDSNDGYGDEHSSIYPSLVEEEEEETEVTTTTTTTTTSNKSKKTRRTYATPTGSPVKPSSLSMSSASIPPSPIGRRAIEAPAPPAPPTPRSNVAVPSSSRATSELPMLHPVPSPQDIKRPVRGQHVQGYYVVWEGRECGIFYSWDDCKKRVVGHANQSYKKFDTWQTAIAAYTASYNIGGVIATPDPGSVYWTEPIPRISEPGHLSLDSEDALWASFGEEDCKARDDLERMMRGLNVANK